MHRLAQQVRVAVRGFLRTPTFVVAVLSVLGVGIGMAVATFSVYRAVLVDRLPVVGQDRVAVLWPYRVPGVELAVPATDLPGLRQASRTLRGIAAVDHAGATPSPLLLGDRAVVLKQTEATANYFDVLGARPVLGRFFRTQDEEPGAPSVIVLSYRGWRSEFGGSASIIGQQLFDAPSREYRTVVGVAPPGLDYPTGVDAWTVIPRGSMMRVFAVARLAPGVRFETAQGEFASIARRLEPTLHLAGAAATPFAAAVVGDARPVLVALAAAVALLLLIACVNVGSLLLVRASTRAGELAVRRALGARYGTLVRQLVLESSILAVAGGVLGGLCAAALLRTLVALAPAQLPRLDDVQLHANVLGGAIAVTAVAVVLFGVLPSLMAARVSPSSPLRLDARSGAETRARRRLRDYLVASQVALAVVMLTGAGLLVRSLQRLEQIELGYRAEHLWVLRVASRGPLPTSPAAAVAAEERVEQRLRAVPGVLGVSPMLMPPFNGSTVAVSQFQADGQTPAELERTPEVPFETAGVDYFRTLGIPVLRGRGFTERDRSSATPIVVISESVARRYWPGQDAIGKRIRLAPPPMPAGIEPPKGVFDWRTVIGVVPDTRVRDLRAVSPLVYFFWPQFPATSGTFAVRSSGSVGGLEPAMRLAVSDVAQTLVLWDFQSMDTLLGGPLARPRLTALLLVAFGVVALVLAAVGLYGVMASTVRERRREIGIRATLGATPRLIRTSLLRRALLLAGAGAAAGLFAALGATRVLQSLLFEVSPLDPLTFAAVVVVLLVVASAATYVPVRRATSIDPAGALRSE